MDYRKKILFFCSFFCTLSMVPVMKIKAEVLCTNSVNLDVSITASGSVSAPQLNYQGGSKNGCYDKDNKEYRDGTTREILQYLKINAPYIEKDAGYLIDVRPGIKMQIFPKSWQNQPLKPNQWVFAGRHHSHQNFWALDLDSLLRNAKFVTDDGSLIGGDIFVPLNEILDLYTVYTKDGIAEDWPLSFSPTIAGTLSGMLTSPKGQCEVTPSSIEFDLGEYSSGTVPVEKKTVTFTCNAKTSANIYVNGNKISSSGKEGVELSTNNANKVVLQFSKYGIVINDANGSDMVDITAKLKPVVPKVHGNYQANAFLDLRID